MSSSIGYTRPSAVLAGLRSTAPLRRASRSGRFQPRTEHATKPLTSSSATPGGPDRAGSPSPVAARSASAVASSKDDDVIGSGRLPSTRAPPPARSALARTTHGITRDPAGLAARVLVAFATASRLQRCFTHGPSPEGEPPARPRPSRCLAAAALRLVRGGTKRCSSTSATQTLREHNHGIDRSPLSEPGARAPERALARSARLVALRLHKLSPGKRMLPGIEAFTSMLGHGWPPPRPRRRLRTRVTPEILRPQAPRRDDATRERNDHQPRFHGPGAGRLSPQAPLAASPRLSPATRLAFMVMFIRRRT